MSSADDLRLVFSEALEDYFAASGDWSKAGIAALAYQRREGSLTGAQRARDVLELRVYRLAKSVMPWGAAEQHFSKLSPEEALGPLRERVVAGDTWSTFMAFKRALLDRRGLMDSTLPQIGNEPADQVAEEERRQEDDRERWNRRPK